LHADDRANELYWGSDHSVNQIAEELDLSKGALYEMIRPLAAGFGCPLCGAEVVHPNRTAKDRGRVDCSACGWDGTEDEALSLDAGSQSPSSAGNGSGAVDDPAADGDGPDEMYPYNDFDAPGPPPAPVTGRDIETRRLVAGGALLGAAVGLALVIWARRR
jgi:predicted RNA-binding Zn-ribbon protein involved in translation (DUF1610 family)